MRRRIDLTDDLLGHDAVAGGIKAATITAAGVSRHYATQPPIRALHDVDLNVRPGEYVCVEGPSGSGKSTLMNLITLIDRPTAGDVSVGAVATKSLRDSARARLRSDTFGFVFQSFHLMPRRTAIENVEVGLVYRGVRRRERAKLAQTALEAVGLGHRMHVHARKLSGGEMQRVAIARAVLSRAPVVVADEPTGNLDSATGAQIVDQLEQLNRQGTTLIVVTHDRDLAERAPRRLFLRDGQIVSDTQTTDASAPAAEPILGRPSKLRLADLISESVAAVGGQPGRTALQVAAIAIAVAMVVVIMGLAATTSAQVAATFDRQRNHRVALTVPPTYLGKVTSTGVPTDFQRRLERVSGISSVVDVERMTTAIVSNEATHTSVPTKVAGVSDPANIALGGAISWASEHSHTLGHHEVIVGSIAADTLGLGPLALDPTLTISGTSYSVVGKLTNADVAPDLTSMLVLNPPDALQVASLDSSEIYLQVVPGAAGQVAQQAPIALNPLAADSIQVDAPPDPLTLRDAVQGNVRDALVAVTIVAALASVLGVANSMMLGVLERVGELGLRRAIGARMQHIVAQIATESLATGVIGGIAGLFAGLFALLAVTVTHHWQPVLDLRTLPIALLGGAVVGIVGGLPASVRAGLVQPADALRR